MRTWILGASFVVAEAISPKHKYELILSIFIIAIGVVGVLADFVEIKRGLDR